MIDANLWAFGNEINIVNVIIYKPFKEFTHSIWKRSNSFDEALDRFRIYYSRIIEAMIPVFSINYRELVENPEVKLKKLCSITGQKNYFGRKKFWKKEQHHLFGSGGIRRQLWEEEYGIKVSTNYSRQFLDSWDNFNEKVQKDTSFNKIMNWLQNRDINTGSINRLVFDNIRKPNWYYYLKGKNRLRSIFPEKL